MRRVWEVCCEVASHFRLAPVSARRFREGKLLERPRAKPDALMCRVQIPSISDLRPLLQTSGWLSWGSTMAGQPVGKLSGEGFMLAVCPHELWQGCNVRVTCLQPVWKLVTAMAAPSLNQSAYRFADVGARLSNLICRCHLRAHRSRRGCWQVCISRLRALCCVKACCGTDIANGIGA